MNEELRIVINAETDKARKNIQGVSGDLKGVEKGGKSGGTALAALGKAATVAAAAVAAVGAAIIAAGAALVKAADSTKEYRNSMAQLTSAFTTAGSTAKQATQTYKDLFRFMGETDTAVEAANLLSKLTTEEKELSQWTTILQGVYAEFPDSLPVEALAESANETAKVGKVTGNLADALNWAGVSEDAFNASLAACNTEAERERLIRETLLGLYSDSAAMYEKNAEAIIKQNEAQHRLNESMARVGKAAAPLQTALTNLSATLLEALAPAIEAIVPYLEAFINMISQAVKWVLTFIQALTGKKPAEVIEDVSGGMGDAASGAEDLTGSLTDANKAAEKLKKTTAGFDELNIVSSEKPSSSGNGSSGGGGGIGTVGGGMALDTSMEDSFDDTSKSAEDFANKIKGIFEGLRQKILEYATLFTPSFEAWKGAFSGLYPTLEESFVSIKGSFGTLWEETLVPFGAYVMEEFVPNITNSFSENIAPIFGEIMPVAIEEFAKDFQWACDGITAGVNDILIPTFQLLETITTDTFDIIGNQWDESGGRLLEGFTEFKDSVKEIWDNLYNKILQPIFSSIMDGLTRIWDNALKPLLEKIGSFVSKVVELVLLLWNNILAPVINWLITVLAPIVTNVLSAVWEIVVDVFTVISDVVGGILDALGGLLDFIIGVFTGDWNRAWQGIKDFFSGIWDAIWGIVKGVINLIIDALNLIWGAIYSVVAGIVNGIGDIAGALGDLFGCDWHFSMPEKPPLIPKLAKGGIVDNPTVAMIGERGKEAVVPLENNTEWMDKLADRIAAKNNTPSKIVLMLDGKELGWANINSINSIVKQTGTLPIVMV